MRVFYTYQNWACGDFFAPGSAAGWALKSILNANMLFLLSLFTFETFQTTLVTIKKCFFATPQASFIVWGATSVLVCHILEVIEMSSTESNKAKHDMSLSIFCRCLKKVSARLLPSKCSYLQTLRTELSVCPNHSKFELCNDRLI